ncbi:MAG: hypothetical protein ACTFAL_16065 [Candidatus Electronema sp. V4]|uniref:hypothetical protein n=1 Tax=Candidatus Electronema sp. V4 TaxID=3454756 RepID=UPI0040556D2C
MPIIVHPLSIVAVGRLPERAEKKRRMLDKAMTIEYVFGLTSAQTATVNMPLFISTYLCPRENHYGNH